MPGSRGSAGVAIVALALAGCLGPPAAEEPPPSPFARATSPMRLPAPDVDFTTAIDPHHGGIPGGHARSDLHTGSFGLELVGYTPLTLGGGEAGSADWGYGAIDVWERFVCVTHFASGGVTIVDIADPAAPAVLATLDTGMMNSDCQFTDDGAYLLLGAYLGLNPGVNAPVPALPPPFGDAAAAGVVVYDVADKAAPRRLFHDTTGPLAVSGAYHNLFTATIDGVPYVFPSMNGRIYMLDAEGRRLVEVGRAEQTFHDLWVGLHPVTGRWVLVTGSTSGNGIPTPGILLYDLSQPANPVLLGTWAGREGQDGWHRQWPLLDTVGGRALLVVAGEGNEAMPYTVLDFTDPSDVTEVGSWVLPGEPVPEPATCCWTFSPHEFETWDGYVASGNYHGGVWVFDIGSPERAAAPVTIGYYLPHESPPVQGGARNKPFAENPQVWGAAFDDRGYVVAPDWHTGLYVLRFGATKG